MTVSAFVGGLKTSPVSLEPAKKHTHCLEPLRANSGLAKGQAVCVYLFVDGVWHEGILADYMRHSVSGKPHSISKVFPTADTGFLSRAELHTHTRKHRFPFAQRGL